MRLLLVLLPVVFLAMAVVWAAPPATRRSDHTDTLHGKSIADPYRWLENPDSPESRAWIKEQNAHTRAWLNQAKGRDALAGRLAEINEYVRATAPEKVAGHLFYLRQDGKENQPSLYMRTPDGQSRVVLDVNTLSKEGLAAIATWAPSPDAKYVAYGIAKAGSDWNEWFVRDLRSGKNLEDHLEWVKFCSPVWSASGDGFYYTSYPKPKPGEELTAETKDARLFFHKVGQKQSEDKLVWERPDQPEWRANPWVSKDGRHLVLVIEYGTRQEKRVEVVDLKTPGAKITALVPDFLGDFNPIGVHQDGILFWTTAAAPRGRVITIRPAKPAQADWKNIIAEAKEPLDGVWWGAGHLIGHYLEDAKSVVKAFTLDGRPVRTLKLPGVGTAFWGRTEQNDSEQFFTYASYTQPPMVYSYDWASGDSKALFPNQYAFDPARFETRQVFYNSKDGTRIPMFLSSRKDLKRDGNNPVLLYGYGGFAISLTPSYNNLAMAWMEMGGIYAVANLRGGAEYGEEWHKAGMLTKKQNVFDDFIAAGEYLIREKYTRREKLAIFGGSNGGLLVGACLNQRPDLFGAAIPAVGVMDMLRFHKFTIGRAWASDYGDPDNPEDFAVLLRYSPLHNIRKGTQYPATMVMTADHDDRVVPAHSFKYAAALQAAQEGKAPILIRIAESAGHGAGKPRSKQIEEQVDVLSFLRLALKMD